MRRVLSDGVVPVKVWTDEIEETALQQLRNLSQLPFVHKHVAVMPDVHAGYGSTVGSVIHTKAGHHPGGGWRGRWLRDDGSTPPTYRKGLPDDLPTVCFPNEAAIPHWRTDHSVMTSANPIDGES